MTEPTLTVDNSEALDDGTFAVWGTLHEDNFGDWTTHLMGYGDTKEAALADLNANALDAYAHAPQDDPAPPADPVDPPEMQAFASFIPNLGSGMLGGTHDLLA